MSSNVRRNRDDALALALAAGKTLRDAAKEVGVSEKTAGRRWANPTFRQRVTELRGEMVARAAGAMGDAMAEAADVLRKLLSAQKETTRLSAARAILEFGVSLRDAAENEARLQALETAAREAAERNKK